MGIAYIRKTRYGTFAIVGQHGGWHAMYGDENLGTYESPEAALDDLVGGHTFFPSNGLDPSEAGLPDELSEWERRLIP